MSTRELKARTRLPTHSPRPPISAVPDRPVTEVTEERALAIAVTYLREIGRLPDDYEARALPFDHGWSVLVVELPGGPGRDDIVKITYDGKVVELHH